MTTNIHSIPQILDSIKHLSPKGGEYWSRRELMAALGYTEWRNFFGVIEKAMQACKSIGEDKDDHFVETNKVIEGGKGAKLTRADYYLDRYACYLIAQNGDPTKPEIASAQTYFAIQTRLQEKLKKENISTEHAAIATHKKVAEEVRAAIKKIGGTMPEDLPIEPSLKQLTKKKNKKFLTIKE